MSFLEVVHGSMLERLGEVEVYFIGLLIVNFSGEVFSAVSSHFHLLRLWMEHHATNWVILSLYGNDKFNIFIANLVRISSEDVVEIA